ncbi:hypothetical protein BDN72DRAFT_900372 [Pluteus cervinus]|uniref:Uncharacterized protein n=1 Tax=Pluteus cervinus TaxID=181527 RepID=A0ACD3AIU7_9AGAR|nr:hypothetical protein BDN72DRAFT_900372 [Pluteus cervinus]
MDHEVLPYEIWSEIVIFAASFSMKQAATLTLVSHAFYDCVQPILYRTFIYYSQESGWPLQSASLDWFQAKGTHIRTLFWGEGQQIGLLSSILEVCTGLESLSVWVYVLNTDIDISALRPSLSKLQLRHLSINVFCLLGINRFGPSEAQDPIFQSITHLDIINKEGPLDWEALMGLKHLPRLTHVCLQYNINPNAIDGVLRYCENVQVVIVVQPFPGEFPSDHRLVMHDLRTTGEWRESTFGEEDVWQRAEDIIAERRDLKKGTEPSD